MEGSNKQYTDKFKNTLVALYHSGQSLVALSREYGISSSILTVWINKVGLITMNKDKTITTVEYQKMLTKMVTIEMENKILKKVTAIFARKYLAYLISSLIISKNTILESCVGS